MYFSSRTMSLNKNFKVIIRIAAAVGATVLLIFYFVRSPKETVSGSKSEKIDDEELSCYSCALVGTAGSLMESDMGTEIDAANCVFRMGFSPISGKERDVGMKTTARTVDSLRFSRFLRIPEKIESTSFASDRWYIFDAQPTDRDQYEHLAEEMKNTTWIGVMDHLRALHHLKKYAGKPDSYKIKGSELSAFWFAVHLMETVSCQDIYVYGVPDPDICKRQQDVDIKSLYWKLTIAPICLEGVDAASKADSDIPQQMPTLLERQAMKEWAKDRQVKFIQPSWPV